MHLSKVIHRFLKGFTWNCHRQRQTQYRPFGMEKGRWQRQRHWELFCDFVTQLTIPVKMRNSNTDVYGLRLTVREWPEQFLRCSHTMPLFGLSSVTLPCILDKSEDRLFLYRLHKQAWLNQWKSRTLIFWPTSVRASQRAYSFTGRGPLPVVSASFVILSKNTSPQFSPHCETCNPGCKWLFRMWMSWNTVYAGSIHQGKFIGILKQGHDKSFSETSGTLQHVQYWQNKRGWGDWGMSSICCQNHWEMARSPSGRLGY